MRGIWKECIQLSEVFLAGFVQVRVEVQICTPLVETYRIRYVPAPAARGMRTSPYTVRKYWVDSVLEFGT